MDHDNLENDATRSYKTAQPQRGCRRSLSGLHLAQPRLLGFDYEATYPCVGCQMQRSCGAENGGRSNADVNAAGGVASPVDARTGEDAFWPHRFVDGG